MLDDPQESKTYFAENIETIKARVEQLKDEVRNYILETEKEIENQNKPDYIHNGGNRINDMFYHHQRSGNFKYRLVMGLLTLCLFLPAAAIVLMYFSLTKDSSDVLFVWIAMLLVFIGLLANFIYLKVSLGGKRKFLFEKFEALPHDEKQEINKELRQKFKKAMFGKHRLYFYYRRFLVFIDYTDIAWAFQQNTAIPLIADVGSDMLAVSSYNNSHLIMYDQNGKRIVADTGLQTGAALADIREHAPNVIMGYSKEKQRLARQDFDRFKVEWKNH